MLPFQVCNQDLSHNPLPHISNFNSFNIQQNNTIQGSCIISKYVSNKFIVIVFTVTKVPLHSLNSTVNTVSVRNP